MFDEQDRQYFYNEFKNNGYEVGSYDDFKKDLNNKEDRDWYYNEAKNMGYDVGTLEDFDKMVLEPAPSTSGGAQQVAASTTTQSVGQNASTETKPQVAQPAAKPAAEKPKEDNRSWFTKWMTGSLPEEEKPETADKEPGLIAKALGMIPTGIQTSNGTYQPSPAISQPVVKGEEMPVKEETSSSSSANAASPESKETAPVTTPTGVVNNEGLLDAKLANYLENWKQRPDKEGDYFENMVADLLADGTANSNEEAVSIVKSALGRYANRSAMDVTNQVVSSLPDDTVQDAEKSIEAQWYSHGVQDKLKQEADNMGISYDDYVGLFLKPAMVQSLVNKYGPNYRNIAEGIATRLYSHDEHVQDRLMNQDINDALSSVISKYVNPSVVDEYNKAQKAGSKAFAEGMEGSQFIPANLRLGTALGAQYEANEAKDPAKVLSGLQKKFGKLYRNPEFLNDMSNAAFKVMQRYGMNGTLSSDPKLFKPMINSVLKNELDQLEIKGMMPKGSAEYIMKTGLGNTIVGKIIRKAVQTDYQNWLEDMANQQYQPGFWENVASGALTFAGDAWSYWLPGAAGGKLTKSMLAKAEGRLAGDLMAKGMESRMAARAAKLLIGKSKTEALKSGAVHGAVTFGGQSAISKPIDEIYRTGQFDENGKIYNPSVGKVIANTLGEVAKQSAVGAIMQGGTIANMVGKGRGLATNILADIGGKVADSGIMTGHQMLERMAQDPNFKPTGKDAAESFLESMANLTAIGLPGMMGKYARFKDAREFNKKYDFTDQDIAELKRFGYEDLRDAFEKVGIGEYAVAGENAQRLDGQLTQKYMNLMNDKSVPEVLKAKMMAVVEGKRPSSFSPIVDSIIVQPMDHDGKVYLETLNKDGGIIDRKEYSSLDEAQKADKKLEYEKTLGLASVLEGEFHNEFTQEHLDGLYNQAAQKYNMGEKLTDEDKAAVYLHQNAGTIKEIMDKQQKGIILTEEEQKQVDTYRHFYNSALENSSVMREFVNTFEDSHGVARGTLRKALESKDKKYAPLVESYLKELYNSIELKREMKQTVDDLYNTAHGNEQKRIEQSGIEGEKPAAPVEGAASVEGAAPVEGTSSVEGTAGGQEPPVSAGPAPYQDRTNSVPSPSDANSAVEVATSDAFVMGQEAYKNGDSETLKAIDYNSDLATGRLKRAFADSDTMFDLVTKAYNEGRDMEQFVAQRAGNLTPAQKEAIGKYVEAMDAKKGAIDALQHADDGYGEALKEQLWPYQTEDGNIVPATLTSGKQVFLKKANEYGGGFVVVPDEQGQPTIKQVSDAEIKEVGTPVSLDEYIESSLAQQKEARAQQFISQFDGSGLKPNDRVTVAMEEGDANIDMTFAGYSEDGKIVLSDGKDYLPLSKEEFAAWRTNALNNTINERLDREDDEREQKAVSQAEADKQERYKKGIFGYASGQPDYSDTQTDPKVAAEYLQETAGEDRKALFANIVAEKQALQKRINQLREHIASNEEWLSINADLDPKNAETRTLANKQMEGQIADLQARFDNWNKIRSAVMTPEEAQAIKADRTQKIADAGVNEGDVAPIEGREVAVLSDEELKKQYPTMDEASDFIASERKRIYRIQSDEVQREIDGVDEVLNRYVNGEIDLEPEQIKELNTTKAQLEARQANLTESAKELKAQTDKLKTLYRKENMEARAKAVENMTPAEQRAIKVENAIKNGNMSQLNSIYEDVRGATDFNDTEPNTLEEYVANNIGRFTLNYEGKEKGGAFSNGIQQETGLGRKDFEKLQILAKEGEGKTVPEFVHSLYDDMPINLKQMGYTDHDIRSAFLDLIGSAQSYSDIKNYTLNNKVANVEQLMRDVERQEEEMKENGTHSEASFGERLKSAIAETEAEPTEAQKKAGNYKKGHLSFGGYDYTVETPKGVTRSGKDEQGKPWSVTMHDTYGYILGKNGVDGDHIDMFINDAADLDTFDGNVYVVDQVNPETGEFDEHKVMYGYPSEEAATEAYLANYSKGWKGLGKVTSVPKATFDKWLESSDRKTKPFADYAMVQKEQRAAYNSGNLQENSEKTSENLPSFGKRNDIQKDNPILREARKKISDTLDELDKFRADEQSFFKKIKAIFKSKPEKDAIVEARELIAKRRNKYPGVFDINGFDYNKKYDGANLPGVVYGIYEKAYKKISGVEHKIEHVSGTGFLNTVSDSEALENYINGIYAMFIGGKLGAKFYLEDNLPEISKQVYKIASDDIKLGRVLSREGVNYYDPNLRFADPALFDDPFVPNELFSGWLEKPNQKKHETLPFDAPMNMDDLPFHRDVKEVKPSDMTEAQKVAYDAVSTMLKKAGIPVKVVSNEDMEKVAEAQDNLNLAMLLNQPEMRFKIKTPEEKQAAENAYNFAKDLRPNKWAQYAVVDMSNPNKMPEYYQKQELARKERTYLNRLMWGNYKVFNLDKSFEDNVAGLTGSFPSEFDPYKIDAQTNKKNELKKQIKETEEAYKLTGQERKEYQNQLMKEYMDEHGLASENDIPDDVWREFDYKAIEKYQDKLDSLFAKYKDLDRQLKAIVQPGVRFLRTYHGTGASFDKFDLSHALEGEGSESFGHGVYVTNSSKIGREYAQRAKQRKMEDLYKNMRYPDGVKGDIFKRRVFGEMVNDVATGGSVASAKEFAKKRVGADVNDIQRTLENLKDREKGTEYEQNLKNRLAEYKEGLKWIDSLDEDYLTQGNANRYDVDIPDDNGSNYLDWEGTIPDSLDKQKVAEDAYKVVSDNQGFNDFKATPLNDFIAHTLKTYVNTTDVAGRVEKLKSDIKDVIENYVADDDVLALNEYLKDATPDDVLATIWYNDLVRDIKDADLGEELYRKLSTYVGDNAASQILSDNGFVGIKYPAGMIHGGAKEGDYNYVIFDENNANIVGNTKFAQDKGVVYGYTDGKEIVLNQEHLNPNTPIHEYQHLWRTAAKEMNPELIAHGDELIKQTQLFADLKEDENYKHLSDDEICDEAFARLTGEDGAAILEQMAKDAIKENPLDTAKELTIINRLKNWLKKFWYWTLDTFTKWKPEDIKKMTLEDIRNLVLRDLANGVDPRNVKSRMTKEDAVSLRKQMEESVEEKIKAVSQQFGVDEADVAMYANAVKKGSTAEAARARANIKRHLLQVNEDKISSFKDIIKYTKPINEALKENFGDLDAMIEERVKQVEAQRNAMEAARKRAEEEEAKRQKHLEELSVIPDDQLDKQYMDALAKGDDATAREMLDEAARRKGYDDTESAYQGVGAWAAPGNPGYESDKARRDDWESSGSDVNLEDMALGYTPQPDDYFSHPERYSQNTPHGLESVKAINTAIDAIKNGEKDVKVKVYRAVPTSVKEGKLRNGDWVTPSKKYAEMHGTNRLEGKYRIIEDEVPATQLWWDGNDANEFGFDDGKAYKYKNAKNNRKLNDLVTYDNKGDVIPPSKRFNSRKSDVRFMFAGEKGAAEADKAEEKTYRMDNLKVAEKMERGKKDAKAIKLATGWERGADGKWRYEMPDAKIKDMKDIGGGNIVKRFDDDMLWNGGKLAYVIDAPGLFEAYPQLKDVRIDTDAIMNDMPSNGNYNAKTNTITIHADELKYMNSILNHEIQHAIQHIEGFGKGGSPEQMEKEFKAAQDEWKARAYAHELEEKAKEMGGEYNQSEVEKALIEEYKDLDMSDELPDKETRSKGFNYFARGYADRSMDDAIKRFRLNESTRSDFDSYKEYLKLAGEVESRNVEKRLGMTDEERRNSLASETEDVNRDEQIVMNGNDASYSIVKDPETIKKLDKEDTVKVYRAMQVGEDGKLYPPMAAKVKGKFVEPIELGKWEQADERPELADDKGMFTLNKGNGKSLKAAYNPYLHTSRTPLNDQFSEAQNRPNIVTVEVEVPKSELTSGYKADKAKDAVGEVEWKAGIIQGQLTGKRKVVLSRWDKPVRIVPDSEVADVIVNDMFKGKNITMPSNVVTPSLRKELEKRGVPFVETDNRGRIVGGENDGVHYSKVYGKKANVKHRFGDSYDYEKYPLGRVEPNLANKDVKIVHADANHGFKNFKEARNWAKKNIVKIYTEEETGGKGLVRISNTALDKYLSQKAVDKSDSQDVHLAVLKVLPSVLKESIDAETHPDFIKGADGERRTDNGINKDLLVHRCYGAVNIDGKIYRVKITLKEEARNKDLPHKAYSYEATKIELLAGTLVKPEGDNPNTNSSQMEPLEAIDAQAQGHGSHSNNSISVANLLKNVEMSYDKGKKLLDESEKMGISIENQRKIADSVMNTANKLGGAEATVYSSLDDVPEEYRPEVELGAKGWYDPETHSVHVYLPNCEDGNDAQRTVFHEKIGHEGMEVLLGGEDEVRKFANFVYNSVAASTRGKILEIANEYDPDWKKHDRMNVGTQEYIARLAEEGPKTAEDFSLWTKIKHYLIKVLKKLGIRVPGLLNDKDLRYYLMKAGKALHVWDNMPKEKQKAMMKQASNAEIKDALSDGAGKGKPRQKKGESMIQYMKRVQEWRKWKNAREDENDPEPPMFYDIDKDEAGKKEWAQLNKDWRERHHLAGEEPTGLPIRMEGEEDGAYMTRIHEYEKWKEAMKNQEDPMPDMFAFEKKKQEEVKRKYEDWLARHELLEQQQVDLDLYEGKIYPAETNPKADDLEQQVMQDLAEVTSTDVSKEGAAKTVKHAVIHRRKNMEEASADDAIYINDVKNRIEKMADSGAFDKLLSDYQGKPNRAEKLAEAIPYIIEAPRRLRDLAHDLNATGAFDKGHIHIQPADVEAIQPYVADLIAETGKKHTELRDGKEVEVYDDPQAVSDVASKMAQVINDNHQGEEGFVPIDGTDILSEHVLPLVKQQIVPEGIDYKNISPEMQAALDSIRYWYNYTYDWLKDNRTLKEDTGYNVDYVNHIWDKEKSDKQAYALYVENRQRTKSPNEKKRTISTLMEGISVGLVPKTTDITKMMAYYSRSNIEAWVNKTMLQELSGLNVIERNEDGEVVSTDPLLSSSAPFNLEQYKYFEIPGVGPVWVYNVSPKQVKVKNPITGKEKVLYSEASAGDRFGVVFETYQSSPFWKAFDTLASSAKKLELGFSGFHAGALTEVYMVQNMVEFGPKKAMANFMKYIFADTAKNHELPCFANPQDFKEAATHLVKFGATNDYAAADVQNMFDNMRDAMMKVQEKLKDGNKISGTVAVATMPLKVVTQMLSLINKGMDRALWDFLHDGLKLATYRMRADKTKERAKKKGWSAEELSRALDEDGQFVNDMFGGQHWDVLGASHRTLRYAGRVLLSPDWNASTTRHFLALTGFGSIWNEATFENFKQYYKRLKHKELTPEDEGRRSRQISALLCYGIGFMVFYEGIANGINAAFRALDEEKERKKAEEIRKTNPSYKSMYELAYGDEGMKWYDYLMRGNSLGQQSKIFMGRYEDGTEMYIRHGKQFREVPEYLFNHKGELEFPGPMVQRMIGKANPMVRMTLDDINYLSDFQASHADQEIQRKYGKTIGLLYKDALYWAPFLIPSQENKEFKAVDFFFPSSKGFSPWKAQSYFKDFILSGDMEGVVMTYQSCQRNGIDPEAQIKAAIGSVKALESAEMQDGVTSLQEASKRFDAAKSITEKKKMRQKMKKFLSQSEYKAFTQKEALDMVQGYLNGDEDLKEMEKAESKYLMKAKAEDVTEDWRIQNVWNGTIDTYQEYQRLKDVDKAKANAFKNSKTNKRLFAARKAISAAKKKMNKAKKQMDGQNDAAKLVEIRKTRKELLETLNGME